MFNLGGSDSSKGRCLVCADDDSEGPDDEGGDRPKKILRMCGDVGNGPTGAHSDGGFDGRFCGKFELQFHGRVVEELL